MRSRTAQTTRRRWARGGLAVGLLAGFLAGLPGGAWAQGAKAGVQESVAGRFDGAILVLGSELGISVEFTAADEGLAATMDIPQQGAWGVPLRDVQYEAPRVYFELLGSPGLATFDGTLEGDSIAGAFEQAGITGTFLLRRAAQAGESEAEETEDPGGAASGR